LQETGIPANACKGKIGRMIGKNENEIEISLDEKQVANNNRLS
jgi:hypothetical protein